MGNRQDSGFRLIAIDCASLELTILITSQYPKQACFYILQNLVNN